MVDLAQPACPDVRIFLCGVCSLFRTVGALGRLLLCVYVSHVLFFWPPQQQEPTTVKFRCGEQSARATGQPYALPPFLGCCARCAREGSPSLSAPPPHSPRRRIGILAYSGRSKIRAKKCRTRIVLPARRAAVT
ncbi:unnamed protein product, partial [Scytosiphon promiscuus]